jgi:hypothetical protein
MASGLQEARSLPPTGLSVTYLPQPSFHPQRLQPKFGDDAPLARHAWQALSREYAEAH